MGNILEVERIGGCTSVIELEGQTFDEAAEVEACIEVSAEDTTIDTTAGVVFRAGEQVVLKEGFTVVQAGFTAVIEEPEASTVQTIEYLYRDHQYFLTSATGAAWGDLEWTYDKIGNRLTEKVDGGTPNTYLYESNGVSGNSPVLDEIELGVGGIADYTFGPAGHLLQVDRGANVVDFGVSDEGRHSTFTRSASGSPVAQTTLLYDGRGFLRRATDDSSAFPALKPTYSSPGVLQSLSRGIGNNNQTFVFYFAGRPVAQLEWIGPLFDLEFHWTYLTTDHLGTPLLATNELGEEVWIGPFRPFGQDYFQGTAAGALDSGVFLRLPGQWEDELWADATSGADVFYNVHRWFETGTARYVRPDPLGSAGDTNPYAYATANPLSFIDPLGERSRLCCIPAEVLGIVFEKKRHCFAHVQDSATGEDRTYAVHRVKGKGCKYPDDDFDTAGLRATDTLDCGEWNEACSGDDCVRAQFESYPSPSDYQAARGPNSNSFARTVSRNCSLMEPPGRGTSYTTPGWDSSGRAARSPGFQCPPERSFRRP